MYRFYNKIQSIPASVANIISLKAPNLDCNDEKFKVWFTKYPTGKCRNAICFKGPLFYKKYIVEIEAKYQNIGTTTPNVPIKYFKNHAKALMLEVQGRGGSVEWEGQNMPLYNVPGLIKSRRNLKKDVTYTHFYSSD